MGKGSVENRTYRPRFVSNQQRQQSGKHSSPVESPGIHCVCTLIGLSLPRLPFLFTPGESARDLGTGYTNRRIYTYSHSQHNAVAGGGDCQPSHTDLYSVDSTT